MIQYLFSRRSLFALGLIGIALFTAASQVNAAPLPGTCTFIGVGNGTTWELASNWSCTMGKSVPDIATTVIIPAMYDTTLNTPISIANLTINLSGKLTVQGTGPFNIVGNVINAGTLTISNAASITNVSGVLTNTGSILLYAGATISVPGTITNNGIISIDGQGVKIIHAVGSAFFFQGNQIISNYTTPASVYVKIQDSSRNLRGNIADTIQATVRRVSGLEVNDTETITLTETGVATGEFVSAPLSLIESQTFTSGNLKLEIPSSGQIMMNYTDLYDATDISSVTASVTVPPPADDGKPPTVTIDLPNAAGAILSGATNAFIANVVDTNGVKSVLMQRIKGNIVTTLAQSDTAMPPSYEANINTAGLTNGEYTLRIIATDIFEHWTQKDLLINISNVAPPPLDVTGPVITILSPAAGPISGAINPFKADVIDVPSGVKSVTMHIGNAPSLSNSKSLVSTYTANVDATLLLTGNYTLIVDAVDNLGNLSTNSVTISVNNLVPPPADIAPPAITINTPSSINTTLSSVNNTFNATVTDDVAVASVEFKIDNTIINTTALQSGVYSGTIDIAPLTTGPHTLSVRAVDTSGKSNSATRPVYVSDVVPPPPGNDTIKPTISITNPGDNVTVANTMTFSASAADNSGVVAGVTFKINGAIIGQEDVLSPYSINVNTKNYATGWYTLLATARDASNNTADASVNIYIDNAIAQVDAVTPTVNILTPKNSETLSPGQFITISANATDNVGVYGVKFMVDNSQVGSEVFVAPYAVTWNTSSVAAGSHLITATVRDAKGNTGSHSISIKIAAPAVADLNVTQAQTMLTNGSLIHRLIKLVDDGNPNTQEDSAVYYVGADNKRHAFSNSKIFFTWYCDFSGVTTVSAQALAAIPLGKNIPYRPGLRMVKFTTDPKVYIVGSNGQLRGVASEGVATSLYGSLWNKQIDDISDAFYSDYTFAAAIQNASDFNVADATQGVQYPSDSLSVPGYSPNAGSHPFTCVQSQVFDASLDSDADGLTNGVEQSIGTDPYKRDSDNDGLSDNEEYAIYKTNPLNADTDGDGFGDKQEIQNGFNPRGAGKCAKAGCTQ